jgi:putative ABC transport system ATP-binding protein
MRADGLTVVGGESVVVRGVDLHARAGEVVGISGPSGAGKTTLLYALAGLIQPAAGRLCLDGRPVVLWRETAAGLIFQNLCLVPLLTAMETVALPLQGQAVSRPEVRRRSMSALAALGLADHADQLVDDLSGGQRQRVAVARALAGSVDVILADEPTSALDPYWRQVVLDLLRAEAARGAVVILASSDAEVMSACKRVITLTPPRAANGESRRPLENG